MTARLNPQQRRAVKTLQGPLLVLAGAGTGKTRVVTYRIAELIQGGVTPSRILAVTFTNKAAREMQSRVKLILPARARSGKRPEISTFHALCVRILRRNAEQLGYPKNFSIYDQGDQESLARAALRDIRVGQEKLRPAQLLAQVSAWKNQAVSSDAAEGAAEGDRQQLAALGYARYQAALQAAGAVDFDDLLLLTLSLLERSAQTRFRESSRFDHVLIDEYQDTNDLQYRITRHLAARHRNLCVVGDDDQSIYGFRGAEVTHILNFERDWPGARVIRLEDNYRSSAGILALANELICHNGARHKKTLRAVRGDGIPSRFLRFEDEAKEAEVVAREIRNKLEPGSGDRVVASDIAVLFRTNEQPRPFELELRRLRVPYVLVGGLSFYDRKEIRDIVSYLKLLANPRDEVALLRIFNTPARGIGPSSIQVLLQHAVSNAMPLWEVLSPKTVAHLISGPAAPRIERFRQLLIGLQKQLGQKLLSDLARQLVEAIGYKNELLRVYPNSLEAESRWQSVEELINSIALYEARTDRPSLIGFLEETSLAGREDNRDDADPRQRHAVTLMTLHSAKGLEFPHVYLVGMEEGLLPHKRAVAEGPLSIAEERRLCYVGVTRAKDTLTLSFAKNRMKWGKLRPSIPSRFLMEMRGESERARRIAEASAELQARELNPEAPFTQSSIKASRNRGKKKRARARKAPRRRSA